MSWVPLVPLKAVAGAFGEPPHVGDDGLEWDTVESDHHLRPSMLVAQVFGKPMEPVIQDGTHCLFATPVEGTRQGTTALVQLRDVADPETDQRNTAKRYESTKTREGHS